MGVPELIARRLQALPPERQAEVLDFVEFLASRVTPGGDWDEREFVAFSLEQAARGDSEEVEYLESDCRELWP